MVTREEWLTHLVEELDEVVFEGDLKLSQFQIGCGRTPGKKLIECVKPYDGMDVAIEDLFPLTIGVDFTIKNLNEIAAALCYELIHACFGIKGCNKHFKRLAKQYNFEEPFNEVHPSDYLKEMIKQCIANVSKTYGDYPGIPVSFKPKEKKEGKKNTLVAFCPECGYELKISRKVFDTYNGGLPTCPCGTKMGLDMSDEVEEV